MYTKQLVQITIVQIHFKNNIKKSSTPLIRPANVTMLLIEHMDTQIQQNKVFNNMKD